VIDIIIKGDKLSLARIPSIALAISFLVKDRAYNLGLARPVSPPTGICIAYFELEER
jgi:hypothetical protein